MMTPSPRRRQHEEFAPISIQNMESLRDDDDDIDQGSTTITQGYSRRQSPDAMSLALSEIDVLSTKSWKCQHCFYKNCDLNHERCASCGIRDAPHVEALRRSLRKASRTRRQASPTTTVTMRTPDEPTTTKETATLVGIAATTIARKPGTFPYYPSPLSTSSSISPPPRRSSMPSSEERQPSHYQTTSRKDSVQTVPPARPGRHDSFHEERPSPPRPTTRRPPKSPTVSSRRPTTPQRLFSCTNDASMVPSRNTSPASQNSSSEGSFASSTAAVKSGYGMNMTSSTTSDTCTDVIPVTEELDGGSSVAVMSYSSVSTGVSTVKASNVQCQTETNKKRTQTKANQGASPTRSLSSAINTGASSLLHWASARVRDEEEAESEKDDNADNHRPYRSQSTPPLRKYQFRGSNGSSVYTIQEDLEQASAPKHPKHPKSSFVPPPVLQHPVEVDHGRVLEGDLTVTPFVHTDRTISVSTFGSTTSMPLDGNNNGHDDTPLQSSEKKRKSYTTWSLIVGFAAVGVGIMGLVLGLASTKGGSSSKFQVGDIPVPVIEMERPTLEPSMEEVPWKEPPQASPDKTAPPFETPDALISSTVVKRVATKMGNTLEHLGKAVAIGRNRVAMLGDGFVRVAELTPTFIQSLTNESIQQNGVDGSEFGRLRSLGSDISIPSSGRVQTRMALSSNGQRLATIAGNGQLSVYEYTSGKDWELLFSDWTSGNAVLRDDGHHTIPAAVSMTADGNYAVAGMIAPTAAGNLLIIQVWQVQRGTANIVARHTETLGNNEPMEQDRLFVDVSNDGEVIAICSKNNVSVKQRDNELLVDIGGQPILPHGTIVEACGLSGNGLTFEVASENRDMVIVYAYQDFWWQQVALIPKSGPISMDYSGHLTVIGETFSEDNTGTRQYAATVWSRTHDSEFPARFALMDRVLGGRDSIGSWSGVSVALSKSADPESAQLLVVGDPLMGTNNGDGNVNVYVIESDARTHN